MGNAEGIGNCTDNGRRRATRAPLPNALYAEFIAGIAYHVEGDVHKSDPFLKKDQTVELANKYKTFSCQYDCHYCPSEPGQPKSYLKLEPAVARANQFRFDTVLQIRNRGRTYYVNGHIFDKLEIIVLGGTITSYPDDYVEELIRDTFYAANTFNDEDFETNPRQRLSLEG